MSILLTHIEKTKRQSAITSSLLMHWWWCIMVCSAECDDCCAIDLSVWVWMVQLWICDELRLAASLLFLLDVHKIPTYSVLQQKLYVHKISIKAQIIEYRFKRNKKQDLFKKKGHLNFNQMLILWNLRICKNMCVCLLGYVFTIYV